MKKTIVALAIIVVAALLVTCGTPKQRSGEQGGALDTEQKQFSYAIGLEVGASVKGIGGEVDLPAFTRGVEDVIKGRSPALSDQEAAAVKRTVLTRLHQKRAEALDESAVKNRQDGDAFLAKNKNQEGVNVTGSGLQYQVLRPGTGPKPKAADRVKVHYSGKLLDGTEFDNSYTRGQPAEFAVTKVIPGWSEGLQLMQVGGKYRLWIPSSLGYGERGAGDKIGPNAVLTFDVELLGIEE